MAKKERETIAAKRRRLQGKRKGIDFNTAQFSLDMEEDLLMEAWDSFTNDDWTRPLRLKAEVENEEENTEKTEDQSEKPEKKTKKKRLFFS